MFLLPKGKVRNNLEKGQALLILLLVLSVALTASLSVVSRSVTDISVTTYEEDASRALSAAEAGVEEVLLTGDSNYSAVDVPLEKSSYSASSTLVEIDGDEFVYPAEILSGESVTFWMVSQDSDGYFECSGGTMPCFRGNSITVYWNTPSSGPLPALEVSTFYDDTGLSISTTPNFSNIDINRRTFDPSGRGGFSTNVSPGPHTIAGEVFDYRSRDLLIMDPISCQDLPGGCILMVRVRSFYNDSPVKIAIRATPSTGGAPRAVPAQGVSIESVGESGESTRKVEVFQSFPVPQTIFDSPIYSYTDIFK